MIGIVIETLQCPLEFTITVTVSFYSTVQTVHSLVIAGIF